MLDSMKVSPAALRAAQVLGRISRFDGMTGTQAEDGSLVTLDAAIPIMASELIRLAGSDHSEIRQIAESLTEDELFYMQDGFGPALVAQSLMAKAPKGTSLVELLALLDELLEKESAAFLVVVSPWRTLVEVTAANREARGC